MLFKFLPPRSSPELLAYVWMGEGVTLHLLFQHQQGRARVGNRGARMGHSGLPESLIDNTAGCPNSWHLSPSGSLQWYVFCLQPVHNKLAPCYKSALLMILLCLYRMWFCFLDHLSAAHGSTASSTASQTQTLWLFTQGTLNCILSFYSWHIFFFFFHGRYFDFF